MVRGVGLDGGGEAAEVRERSKAERGQPRQEVP